MHPYITLGVTLLNIERGLGKSPGSRILFGLKNIIQPGFIFFFPIISNFAPSGVFLYWATSATYTLAQSHALESNRFRKALSLPLIPTPAIGAAGGAANGGEKHVWDGKGSNGSSSSQMKSLHDVNKMYAEDNDGKAATSTPRISSNLIGYVDLSDIKTNRYNYYGSDIPVTKETAHITILI